MDERRKAAYRWLLYNGVISIRSTTSWAMEGRTQASFRSLFSGDRRQSAHKVFWLADAFHNLAKHSASDFAGFDEQKFWNHMAQSLGEADVDVDWYHETFQNLLTEDEQRSASYNRVPGESEQNDDT
ncbi:MAG: hypothetical protein H8F28_12775 [Fibrella sp.]|nr:hypothetical protein [Armatimonadota bacterium]